MLLKNFKKMYLVIFKGSKYIKKEGYKNGKEKF